MLTANFRNATDSSPREFDNVDDYVEFIRKRTFFDEFSNLFTHPNELPRFRPNPDPHAGFIQDGKNIRNYFRAAMDVMDEEIENERKKRL